MVLCGGKISCLNFTAFLTFFAATLLISDLEMQSIWKSRKAEKPKRFMTGRRSTIAERCHRQMVKWLWRVLALHGIIMHKDGISLKPLSCVGPQIYCISSVLLLQLSSATQYCKKNTDDALLWNGWRARFGGVKNKNEFAHQDHPVLKKRRSTGRWSPEHNFTNSLRSFEEIPDNMTSVTNTHTPRLTQHYIIQWQTYTKQQAQHSLGCVSMSQRTKELVDGLTCSKDSLLPFSRVWWVLGRFNTCSRWSKKNKLPYRPLRWWRKNLNAQIAKLTWD